MYATAIPASCVVSSKRGAKVGAASSPSLSSQSQGNSSWKLCLTCEGQSEKLFCSFCLNDRSRKYPRSKETTKLLCLKVLELILAALSHSDVQVITRSASDRSAGVRFSSR